MSSGPDAPPAAPVDGARYRSAAGLAQFVTLAFAPYVAGGVFRLWVLAQALEPAQARVAGAEISLEPLELFAGAYGSAGAVKMVSMLLGIVAFCLWTYRVAVNARAFGAADVSPGWSVGAYFVPLANGIAPLLSLRRIWLASSRDRWVPRFVYAWWFAWLVAGPFVQMTDARADFTISPTGSVAFMKLAAFASAIDLLAIGLMLAVVWTLTRRQQSHDAPT
jgi:hypothetical protein